MSQTSFARNKTRIKNAALAFLFMGTQVLFPIMSSGVAHAAAAANLDQCRNGTILTPVQCAGNGSGATGWVNGNAGQSNSHWREGDSLAYRMRMTDLALGSHNLTISWGTTKGGKHAIDYLTTYNRTETTADPCSTLSCSGSTTTFAIPDDPNSSVAQVPGVFTLFGGTITAVSGYTLSGNYAGDSETSITITFTADSDHPVLAWGGHIASQIDWGVGNSASAISGSPYHMALVSLDGTGGSQDRSLSADAVFPTPNIKTQTSSTTIALGQTVTDTATVTGFKNNTPLAGTVTFYVCGPSNTNPLCDIGGQQVGSPITLNVTPTDIPVGTATSAAFTPSQIGRYCFRAVFTPADNSPYSPQEHTNQSSTPPYNECFAVNYSPGTITIFKDALPNSTQDFAFTTRGTGLSGFTLDDDSDVTGADNTFSNSRIFTNLSPTNTYTFTESSTGGWDLTSLSCISQSGNSTFTTNVTGRTANVTLGNGDNVTCTFTNTQRGRLIVQKTTLPATNDVFSINATSSTGGVITGGGAGTVTNNTDFPYEVTPGTYSVSEDLSNMPGWSKDDSGCQNVVIGAGETKYCTITNTKLAKLKIVKDAVPNSAQDFAFTTSGTGLSEFTLDDDDDNTRLNFQQFINLAPGNYTVTEGAILDANQQPLWDLTGLTCTGTTSFSRTNWTLNVTLAAGEDITCTFTNTQRGSISGLKYEANANGTTVGTLEGWTINLLLDGQIVATDVTDANGAYSFDNLQAGLVYTLSEILKDGFTQIFAPVGTFTVQAGQTIDTGTDFGNFENASISGYKWNDVNGDAQKQENESKLSRWTVTLYNDNNDADTLLNNQVATTVTDGTGNYAFTNVIPGDYKVCETQQANWTQTYPVANDGCHLVTVAISGHNYADKNFGNQGRGTIQVLKNLDTDGDGDVDTTGSTGWTWDINGTGNFATGSVQNVAAGTYTINEDQQTDYHFTSVVCTLNGRDFTVTQAENLGQVTVAAGDSIVCTYLNTRDTGTVTVIKNLVPSTDDGLFNLRVSSTIYAANVGDGGTTGAVRVPTGSYTASETAGTDTNLNDYTTSYSCSNELTGDGTTTDSFTVGTGENITCTFTNTRHASITVVKQTNPANDPQDFDFTLGQYKDESLVPLLDNSKTFTLDTDSGSATPNSDTTNHLQPDTYYITEDTVDGWDLTNVTCGEGVRLEQQGTTIAVTITAGQNVTCTFTNTKRGSITVVKDATPNSDQAFEFTATKIPGTASFSLVDNGTAANTRTFSNLVPDTYGFAENSLSDWDLTSATCTDGSPVSAVVLSAGESITCTFTNTQRGHIIVKKVTDPATDANTTFEFNPSWSDTNFTLKNGESNDSGALVSGIYSVQEMTQQGWDMTNTTCSDGSPITAIELGVGETVTCTFTNTQKGHLIVQKTTLPATDTTFTINATSSDGGVVTGGGAGTVTNDDDYNYEVTPGTYSVEETVPEGWSKTGDTCQNVSVAAGETKYCLLTNTKHASITVVKQTDPANDPQDFDFTLSQYQDVNDTPAIASMGLVTDTFTLDDDDESELPNSNTTDYLLPGTYYITEDQLDGWDLTNITCGEGVEFEQEGSMITVTISAGDNITCTFTNTKRGSITIIKDAQPDGPQAFSFNTSIGEDSSFTLVDDGLDASKAQKEFSNLTPGAYAFSEEFLKGWTLSDIYCDSENALTDDESGDSVLIRLQAGENVTCTFTNTRDMGTITVTKTLTPSTDTGTFNLLINGVVYAVNVGDNGTTGEVELPTGSYTVSELGGTGTDLGAYESSYVCTNGDETLIKGAGSTSTAFNLEKGDNIFCTFKNNKGEILGEVAPVLVNTGSNPLLSTVAALTFITTVIGLALATRRLQNPTSR